MAAFKDLTGLRFGRLEVKEFSKEVQSGKRNRKYWLCNCECGKECEVRTDCLTSGGTVSCGCHRLEVTKKNLAMNHSHKASRTRIYNIWQSMKARCENKKNNSYGRYGARGIEVCNEWKVPKNFIDWAYANGYEENLTLDRIDNNGNYEPSNCRWANSKTQCRNRSSNVMINYNNKMTILIEVSEKTNIPYNTLHARYSRAKRKGEVFEILDTPTSR